LAADVNTFRKEDEHSRTGRGLLLLWIGFLLGPVAFLSDLQLSYSLVRYSCDAHRQWVLYIVTPVALGLTAVSIWAGWKALLMLPKRSDLEGDSVFDRSRFMAYVAIMMSLLSGLVIIAMAIPRYIVNPCDYT